MVRSAERQEPRIVVDRTADHRHSLNPNPGPPSMPSSYIVAARRTPIGKLLGGLSTVPAPQLAVYAIRAALADSHVASNAVDHVILGNVLSAGIGQAPARQASIAAGVPPTVGAVTIN